jgi:hypothetical protein
MALGTRDQPSELFVNANETVNNLLIAILEIADLQIFVETMTLPL